MRSVALFLVLLIIPSVVSAEPKDKEVLIKEEMKKLQGPWVLVTLERQFEPKVIGGILDFDTITVLEAKYIEKVITITDDKVEEGKLTFRLDPTRNPKTVDLTSSLEENATWKMIYSLEGDDLKVRVYGYGDSSG